MNDKVIIYSDGGARNNPGPAGIGVVIWNSEQTEKLAEISEYIGETTNNQAEYRALLAGLKKAGEMGVKEVKCFLDSELVVKQLNLIYKVKEPAIASIFVQVWNELQGFKKYEFIHVRREKNKDADTLVNKAIDNHFGKSS